MKFIKYSLTTLAIFVLLGNTLFLIKLSISQAEFYKVNTFIVSTPTTNSATTTSSSLPLVNPKRSINQNETAQDIVNQFATYTYTLRPKDDFCGRDWGKNLLFIAFVPVSPKKFDSRTILRTTWGQYQAEFNFKMVFIVGHDDNSTFANDMIKRESDIYGDIVQSNFSDTYFNLTTKTMMGFRWVSTYCGNAKYTLKVDDDIIVSIPRLTKYLKALVKNNTRQTNSILCKYYKNSLVQRGIKSKFYMSIEEYPQKYFNPYCDGQAYILTTELVGKMFDVSLYIKQIKFEDVYIGVIFYF